MATAIRRRNWPRIGLVLLVLLVAVGLLYREPLLGYARTGAAFGARTSCACRYIARRSLKDCKKDFEPGMWAVFLSDDVEGRSVTGYVPLLSRQTARFRAGYGCLLDPWTA